MLFLINSIPEDLDAFALFLIDFCPEIEHIDVDSWRKELEETSHIRLWWD